MYGILLGAHRAMPRRRCYDGDGAMPRCLDYDAAMQRQIAMHFAV